MGREQYHNHDTDAIHIKKLEGDVTNADTVIVYGDVKGNITNCDNVVIINGEVKGDIINSDNVCGLLANESIGKDALWHKAGDGKIKKKDLGDDLSIQETALLIERYRDRFSI